MKIVTSTLNIPSPLKPKMKNSRSFTRKCCTGLTVLALTAGSVCASAELATTLMLVSKDSPSDHSSAQLYFQPQVTDIESCYQDVQHGRQGDWKFYQPPAEQAGELRTYRCVYTEDAASISNRKLDSTQMFMVVIEDNVASFTEAGSYRECLMMMRSQTNTAQNIFCAESSQPLASAD